MTPSIPTAADIAAVVFPPDMLQPTTYVMCGGCGVYLHGDSDGTPRRCRSCRPSKAEQKAENIARHEAHIAMQKKAPCHVCGKRVKAVGMADHQRDAHGGAA